MPAQPYEAQLFIVNPSTGIGTWNPLPNFQSFTVNIGREAQLDQYNADTATLVFRWPQPYTSIVAALTPGKFVRIINTTTKITLSYQYINDVQFSYGIPYESGTTTSNADYLTVTTEADFAIFSRMSGANYAMAAGTLTTQMATAATQTNLLTLAPSDGATTQMAATTISGTWGDWFNAVCLTLNNRLRQRGIIEVVSKYNLTPSVANFSDTTNNATNQVYEQIEFQSLADNFYTQVTVDPESFGPATVSSGAAPYRTYSVNTLNASTNQATDYANYLLNNYKTPVSRISKITCRSGSQSVFKLDDLGNWSGFTDYSFYTGGLVGYQVSVAFRGTTYTAVVEGVTISGTPSEAVFTYNLSAGDLNAYLILDDSVFGKLDNNKLGY